MNLEIAKKIDKLIGNHKNWCKLKSMIDEGVRYPIQNYDGYIEDTKRSYLGSAVALGNNKSSHRPK